MAGVVEAIMIAGGSSLVTRTTSGILNFKKIGMEELQNGGICDDSANTEQNSSITLPNLSNFFNSNVEDVTIKVRRILDSPILGYFVIGMHLLAFLRTLKSDIGNFLWIKRKKTNCDHSLKLAWKSNTSN